MPVPVLKRLLELALYATSPLATLITAPLLARGLEPAARGQFGVIMAVAAFFVTVGAWGQQELIIARAREGDLRYREHRRVALVFGGGAAVATLIVLLVLGLPLAGSIAGAVFVPLLVFTGLWRSLSIAGGRLRGPAFMNLATALIRIAALGTLVAASALDLTTAVVASQASVVLGAVIAVLPYALRHHGADGATGPGRSMLALGAAVIAFDVFNAVALRADLVVLQLRTSPEQLGIYAAPASVTTAALALSAPFKARIQILLVRHRPVGEMEKEILLVGIIGSLGAAALVLLAPFLVAVLFGADYAGSVLPLQILAVAVVPLLIFDLAQGILTTLAARRQLIVCGAFSAAATVVAMLVLVGGPQAAVQAAIASLLSNVASAAVTLAVALRAARSATR
ncbi:lipopolysaccharide biosynthesis protein [uncultured Amnibacterium sp.]|uniref:lipopolysaccharide biosynthesis protein n=1 Tax=uncultured Amnibacterium sp. TaxID=1631851 RepID=UPI0035CBE66C